MGRRLTLAAAAAALLVWAGASARATAFSASGLVTDDQAAHPAQITDPALVNPWGVSFSPASPFWVSDNATGLATLYRVNPATNATTKLGLEVSIPGAGSVTGQAFNSAGAAAFHGDPFLFVSEDGTISGWRGALGTTAETLAAGTTANVYKGAALASVGGHGYLYGANFRAGSIDVLRGDAAAPGLAGAFADPNIPAGYAPFNVENIGGTLYVTYALQDGARHDDVAGAGHGFVDAYDLNGNFLRRIGTQGALNSPWGLALAPASFGSFAGDLLVGNFGDGLINVYDPTSGTLTGQLDAPDGTPLAIDGLWALTPGNGVAAGSPQAIYFSSGPDGESHGLFGVIAAVPEPGSSALLGAGLVALGLIGRRRKG